MVTTKTEEAAADTRAPQEPVWSYRGYDLRSSEFTTAMVHYYRAEIQRSNTWRTRLDATTNWAVLTAGAAISFVLSSPENHYAVIILDALLITLFVWIEARRYRYYELWSYRARLLETDFFAAMLVPPFGPRPGWGETLAESLLQPEFPISLWEAFGRRLRRNYLWIFTLLGAAWALKVFLHPVPAPSWAEFVSRSALGAIPGEVMIAGGLVYNGLLWLIGLLTMRLQQASGEVLPKYGELPPLHGTRGTTPDRPEQRKTPWERITTAFRPHRQRLLALVITGEGPKVARRLLDDMRRGVTDLPGRGSYTGAERNVLMVALTVTEVAQLKTLVSEEDPQAFVIVIPAQEVLGRGFSPLTE